MPMQSNPYTLADFRRLTEHACMVQRETAFIARRSAAQYVGRLSGLYVVGGLLWLASPALSTALALTGTLGTAWYAFKLARCAKRLARQNFLAELSQGERSTAVAAWSWLSYIRSVMNVRLLGLSAGMCVPPAFVLIWTGHPAPEHVLHLVALVTCCANAMLVALARSLRLVAPLLQRLSANPA